jgi:GxxExxY protein
LPLIDLLLIIFSPYQGFIMTSLVRGDKELTEKIIGAAIEVHRSLGPGLLESAYEACLIYELSLRGLRIEYQKPLPITYKHVILDCGYRLDLIVEDQVIIEVTAPSPKGEGF